jgi:Holliday junction resolvase RusA-like endonuclease
VEASCGKEEEVPVIIRELDNLLKQTSDAMYLDFFIPGT